MPVITFSRQFPAYHERAGQPTYFVEKILRQLDIDYESVAYFHLLLMWNADKIQSGKLKVADLHEFQQSLNPKIDSIKPHTIRGGNRWKPGMTFSPTVWSGTPYASPQITFCHDTKIVKTWNFYVVNEPGRIFLETHPNNTEMIHYEDEEYHQLFQEVSRNDGLSEEDMLGWFKFPKPFDGQIICWGNDINY
jgi:hypothetical protein